MCQSWSHVASSLEGNLKLMFCHLYIINMYSMKYLVLMQIY